jgi:hypothetical protein
VLCDYLAIQFSGTRMEVLQYECVRVLIRINTRLELAKMALLLSVQLWLWFLNRIYVGQTSWSSWVHGLHTLDLIVFSSQTLVTEPSLLMDLDLLSNLVVLQSRELTEPSSTRFIAGVPLLSGRRSALQQAGLAPNYSVVLL